MEIKEIQTGDKVISTNTDKMIGTADEALGLTILKRLEADHIVPMDLITKMDGFNLLTRGAKIVCVKFKRKFHRAGKISKYI